MRAEAIREALTTHPFRPFRLYVSDGASYDVHHPDFCLVGVHDVFVGFPGREESAGFEHFTLIALTHVTRLEPIPPAAPPSSGPSESPSPSPV